MVWDKVRVPLSGIGGAGTGAVVGELCGETVSRATGFEGWKKVGVKGAVKGLLLGVFYGVSTKVPGLWSIFTEMAGYSAAGTIFFDIIGAIFPGGVYGIAEGFAVSMRTAALGAEKVKEEIESLEKRLGTDAGKKIETASWI